MPLNEQIEAAFDFRGHVTLTLTDQSQIVGFLFNRDAECVELILEGSAEKKRYLVSNLAAVELTGTDEAAGKSYDET